MHKDLQQAIEHLVHHIKNYESDVYSGIEEEVTQEEAERAVAELIYNHLIDRDGIAMIDGADVGFAVDTVRQTEEEKEAWVETREMVRAFHESD